VLFARSGSGFRSLPLEVPQLLLFGPTKNAGPAVGSFLPCIGSLATSSPTSFFPFSAEILPTYSTLPASNSLFKVADHLAPSPDTSGVLLFIGMAALYQWLSPRWEVLFFKRFFCGVRYQFHPPSWMIYQLFKCPLLTGLRVRSFLPSIWPYLTREHVFLL